ncbi:hypothetical protein Tco_1539771 [Tanacetum coccineum]
MTLSPSSFRKRYGSSYETPSSSASPEPSLTLPIRNRYQGTSEPILNTKTEDDESKAEGASSGSEESEDEGPDLEGEQGQSSRSVPEQQVADATPTSRIPVLTTWIDPDDNIVYLDIKIDPLSLPTPVASIVDSSPVASPAMVEAESFLVELGAHVEFQGGLLHDHAHRLDALPPTLFEGYDRDLRRLYTRSRAVRDEIFSQRYRLRSLEEQERATVTFDAIWRPVLALES